MKTINKKLQSAITAKVNFSEYEQIHSMLCASKISFFTLSYSDGIEFIFTSNWVNGYPA